MNDRGGHLGPKEAISLPFEVAGDDGHALFQLVFHEITVLPIALIVIRIIFLDQDRNTRGVKCEH